MLRRATCASHGQTRSLVHGPSSRSSQQYTIQAKRPASFRYPKHPTCLSRRTLSTQHATPNETQQAEDADEAKEESPRPQSSNAAKHAAAGVEDDGTSAFNITPRYNWNWRPRKVSTPVGRTPTKTNGIKHLPLSPEARREAALQSIAGSIGGMIKEARIPSSPLEKELEGKEWIPKRQPTEQEKMKLSYNPWAMMLAGNMRLDAGSKIRLPGSLLLVLSRVAQPDNPESVWMLPDELANLEAYDQRLRKALRRLAMQDLHRKRGGDKIHILPYKLLVEGLTDELVVWDKQVKRGRTKNGVIAKRLLPGRWLERNQRIEAYQRASSEYWKVRQTQDKPDDPAYGEPEKPTDVLGMQWQPNVGERILSIMRQRVILSLDHLGQKIYIPETSSLNKSSLLNTSRLKRIACFEWPDSLYLNVNTGNSLRSDSLPEKPDSAGLEHDESVQYREKQPEPKAPDDDSIDEQLSAPDLETYRINNPDFWLPGSYFLHIGPPETTLTALAYTQEHETFPTSRSVSKINPPMIAVHRNRRLPVFNLPALLGPKFDPLLQEILRVNRMVLRKENAVRLEKKKNNKNNDGDDSENQNYLIHIRATAPASHFLLKELWQLWRYMGGTDCLRSPEPTEPAEQEPTSEVQMEKDKIKGYHMAKKVWDNLYTLLPGIERKGKFG